MSSSSPASPARRSTPSRPKSMGSSSASAGSSSDHTSLPRKEGRTSAGASPSEKRIGTNQTRSGSSKLSTRSANAPRDRLAQVRGRSPTVDTPSPRSYSEPPAPQREREREREGTRTGSGRVQQGPPPAPSSTSTTRLNTINASRPKGRGSGKAPPGPPQRSPQRSNANANASASANRDGSPHRIRKGRSSDGGAAKRETPPATETTSSTPSSSRDPTTASLDEIFNFFPTHDRDPSARDFGEQEDELPEISSLLPPAPQRRIESPDPTSAPQTVPLGHYLIPAWTTQKRRGSVLVTHTSTETPQKAILSVSRPPSGRGAVVIANSPFTLPDFPLQREDFDSIYLFPYFEVKIMEFDKKTGVCVGFVRKGIMEEAATLPGWMEGTFALFSSGKLFGGTPDTELLAYGRGFGLDDVVGCGVDYLNRLFFTVNGKSLGPVTSLPPNQQDGESKTHFTDDDIVTLVPAVGVIGPAKMYLTCGPDGFCFDTRTFGGMWQSRLKRDLLTRELFSSELTYVKFLRILVDDFLLPIRNEKLLSEDHITTVFSNVEVILNLHSKLLDALDERIRRWTPQQFLSVIFHEFIHYLKLYTTYTSGYDTARRTLELCQDKSIRCRSFCKMLEKKKSQPELVEGDVKKGELGLLDLLIMPCQRIPRYKLLLGEILRLTPDDHPDKERLGAEVDKLIGVADHINRQVGTAVLGELVEKVSRLKRLLDSKRQFISQNVIPKSLYELEDRFTMREEGKGTVEIPVSLILFSDMLVIVHRMAVHSYFDLRLTWVDDTVSKPRENYHAFEVLDPAKAVCIICRTQTPGKEGARKTYWMEATRRAFETLLKESPYGDLGTWRHNKEEEKKSFVKDPTAFKPANVLRAIQLAKDEVLFLWRNPNPVAPYNWIVKIGKAGSRKMATIPLSAPSMGLLQKINNLGRYYFYVVADVTGSLPDEDESLQNLLPMSMWHLFEVVDDPTFYVGSITEARYGRFEYEDKSVYEGCWLKRQRHGFGMMNYANKVLYEGKWDHNRRHGIGVLTFPNGNRYEGNFINDKMEGKGTMFYVHGEMITGYHLPSDDNNDAQIFPDGDLEIRVWSHDPSHLDRVRRGQDITIHVKIRDEKMAKKMEGKSLVYQAPFVPQSHEHPVWLKYIQPGSEPTSLDIISCHIGVLFPYEWPEGSGFYPYKRKCSQCRAMDGNVLVLCVDPGSEGAAGIENGSFSIKGKLACGGSEGHHWFDNLKQEGHPTLLVVSVSLETKGHSELIGNSNLFEVSSNPRPVSIMQTPAYIRSTSFSSNSSRPISQTFFSETNSTTQRLAEDLMEQLQVDKDVNECIKSNSCTICVKGKPQFVHHCYTCKASVCIVCKALCHQGHDLNAVPHFGTIACECQRTKCCKAVEVAKLPGASVPKVRLKDVVVDVCKQIPIRVWEVFSVRICTWVVTGKRETYQIGYECRTCRKGWGKEPRIICSSCCDRCHRGHDLSPSPIIRPFSCECRHRTEGCQSRMGSVQCGPEWSTFVYPDIPVPSVPEERLPLPPRPPRARGQSIMHLNTRSRISTAFNTFLYLQPEDEADAPLMLPPLATRDAQTFLRNSRSFTGMKVLELARAAEEEAQQLMATATTPMP